MILAVTAITNFILACELFFLVGMLVKTPKTTYSAAWLWTVALWLLGVSALLGGIDHGFLEPLGQSLRAPVKRLNWIMFGLTTFCILMATVRHFLSPKLDKIALVVGLMQFALYIVLFLIIDRFIVVILNLSLVLALLLILSIHRLKDGAGSWSMIIGIIILAMASIVQTSDIVLFAIFDEDGLFHLIIMIGVMFLYWGGQQLKHSI